MIYPWHIPSWQQLTQQWHKQPNAWLFTGKKNTGKTTFARHLAQALLCETPRPDHNACHACPSCHLFAQNTHPDFYPLSPEIAENTGRLSPIKIDAVRAILDPLMQSAVRGGKRVVLISPAENVNLQAANALLKILEEPPADVVFLLVSHQRDRVLPTIKSRCRTWILPAPDLQAALNYLREQNTENAEQLLAFHSGTPLFASAPEHDVLREQLLDILAQPRLLAILDYVAVFERQKLPLAALLDWLHKWLIDVSLSAHHMSPQYYPHRQSDTQKVAQKIMPAALFRFSGSINRLKPYGQHSLNVKMQAEDLLCAYLMMFTRKTS